MKKSHRGGVSRSRKEQKATSQEEGTGALGGFMPYPTGKVLKRAFGGDKQEPEKDK